MEFVGDIARKTGTPSLLAVEAAKTERAGRIGKESGLFYVPKVVRFDQDAGILEFERLRGSSTLLELAVRKDARTLELSEQAGRALAVIHDRLTLPDEMKEPLPAEWMDAADENVFIHGDFTLRNVCFHEHSGQLVILDWSGAPLLGRTPTYGSRLFDMIWFVNYLFCGTPRKGWFTWGPQRMADLFLSGYAGQCPEAVRALSADFAPLMRHYYRETVWWLARQRPLRKAVGYLLYQLLIYPRFARYQPKQE